MPDPTLGPALAPSMAALLPVAVTLVLSLWTRNVIVGLFAGVCVGTAQLGPLGPLTLLMTLIPRVVTDALVPQLTDTYNAGVLVLLVFIGGFVALMEQSGGAGAFARRVIHLVTSPLRAQLGAWLGGILIFFSDLGTPLIVGPVFRPLTDRLGVSRQKLALILDATASPVAILIPFIGWGVYSMGLIRQAFDAMGSTESDYAAFVATIPFQFYAWLAIATVPIVALSGRDWGAMRSAESAAARGEASGTETTVEAPPDHPAARPSLVWMPLVAMGVTLLATLGPLGFPFEAVPGSAFRAGLATAYFVAAAVLIALAALQGVRRPMANVTIYLRGMSNMMGVAVTLVLAWALSDIGTALGAAEFVAHLLSGGFPPALLPACVFVAGGLISFATGSSWGTFAILMGLVIPAAAQIGAPMTLCIAAVLSGGLFGDHASPISETTILSATGAGSAQFDHFRTQMPYAVANGAVALAGFVVAGFVPSPLVLLAVIATQVAAWLLFMPRAGDLSRDACGSAASRGS
ncbi:MAG TPA: Na+/H+ antiporter NhaC family protein [Pseudomonadales bacterium]|nr:Na+/H+ antiporter NhaC family protein [Pseudomonadales bacterium]